MSLRSQRDQIDVEYEAHERFLASLTPAQRYGYDLDTQTVIATSRCPRATCRAELGESCRYRTPWLDAHRIERAEAFAHVERRLTAGEMLCAHPPRATDAVTRSCLAISAILESAR